MSHQLSAVDRYARLGLRTDIETASPHRIILLLMDGALDKLRIARLAMEQGQIAAKGANISWTISIIDGLRASLNLEQGGDVAANLDNLYEYIARALAESNLDNDVQKLNDVERVLGEIRAGWKGIESQASPAHGRTVHNEIGPTAVGVG